MENFTPYSALIGGALIGLSASLLLLLNGRIAGISGILNGSLFADKTDKIWRWCFIIGLILGGLVVNIVVPEFNSVRQHYPVILLVLGGFLVGFGTRLANGCVSGHGVCGLANRSVRSLVATGTFMLTAMLTVYVLRHLLGIAV